MKGAFVKDLSPVEVAVTPVDKFREYLEMRGKRLTPERALIVEEVFSSHEHFDPDQLIERLTLRKDRRRVSRSTVYRTLTDLENAGLLRKVARNNDRDIYEHDYGYPQHDHLICGKCGELIEFTNSEISDMLERIASERGFRMTGHRLEVFGTCNACVQSRAARHKKLNLM